jgi:soluble methane monooxygenase-binding protein MmoD
MYTKSLLDDEPADSAIIVDEEAENLIEICREGSYRAVVEDLGFMWRWNIYRDGEMCQEGCSLSEGSSREAVRHVMAFYRLKDESAAEAAAGTS